MAPLFFQKFQFATCQVPKIVPLLVLIFPLAIWMGVLYQRKRKLKIHPDYLISEGGIFGDSSKLIEIYKIQSVTIHSSPMQRRRKATSLHIYTAGGNIAFPYINEKIAKQARNYILYRAEAEKKSWIWQFLPLKRPNRMLKM